MIRSRLGALESDVLLDEPRPERDCGQGCRVAGSVIGEPNRQLERGAHLKLTPGNLWQRFAFGGFGSDAEERADILRAAFVLLRLGERR